MAAYFNKGSHQDPMFGFNQHSISFQPRAVASESFGSILGRNSSSMNCAAIASDGGGGGGLPLLNSQAGTSSGGVLDSVSVPSHDSDLAVEWSNEEQLKLERGLAKYADIPNMWKYIKIAAMLPEKTVRDVAMRYRWMKRKENGKRRKPEGLYSGKKMNDRNEKVLESSCKSSIPPSPAVNMAACPLPLHHTDRKDWMPEVSEIGSTTWHLLEENSQVLGQIMTNLMTFKIEENIDLLYRTRNNIISILNK
ncbi:hypothetical protein Scep_022722 [Stephania cephalantha]|uniref:Myb-like domain-containing protein n=1 Tax=Stephania cephalantha TaxID=152367 RepID=A0AAP0FGR6_9MAGN